MKRTYVDLVGEYYDNLDQVIDWDQEVNKKYYDLTELVKSPNYPNSL